MKPKTKKTLIIAAAIVAIVAVVWLVFCKQGWKREISKLNLNSEDKKRLTQAVKHVLLDPAYTKQQYEATASAFGITYNQWIVVLAAQELGWVAGTSNGQLDIRPVTGQSSIIPNN